MKNNFKSYAFCFGVCAAIIGVVVAIGNAFNFKVDEVALTSIITAILGVLVAMGIIQKEENELENTEFTDDEQEQNNSLNSYDEQYGNLNNVENANIFNKIDSLEADDEDKK